MLPSPAAVAVAAAVVVAMYRMLLLTVVVGQSIVGPSSRLKVEGITAEDMFVFVIVGGC